MKTLLTSIAVVLAIIAAFFSGTRVGSSKTWIYSKSIEAYEATWDIEAVVENFENIEECEKFSDGQRIADIYDSILDYGRYLDHWSSKVPIMFRTDEATHDFYEEAISFYLENHYRPPELSAEESVRKTIDEMLAEGTMSPESSEQISRDLIQSIKEERGNFERAINSVKK